VAAYLECVVYRSAKWRIAQTLESKKGSDFHRFLLNDSGPSATARVIKI
jgi:hypothetical protein